MATIHKVRNSFVYALAILIGGVFSFIGKPAPTWAKEAKKAHSAQVFNESFFGLGENGSSGTLVAQADSDDSRSFSQPSDRQFSVNQRSFSKDDGRSFSSPTDMRYFSAPAGRAFTIDRMFSAPEQAQTVNSQLDEKLKEIQAKIQGREPLDAGEIALLVELENSRRIESLSIMMNRKIESK